MKSPPAYRCRGRRSITGSATFHSVDLAEPAPANAREVGSCSGSTPSGRAAAYLQGRIEFAQLIEEPTFREFICLYMAEGYKRSRNTVAVCNSDPRIMALCAHWVRRFARNPVRYSIQYHADQNLDGLRAFWAKVLHVTPEEIALQRKSNSGHLVGRVWRSQYGVLRVSSNDTLFRARVEAWIHSLQDEWLHSTGLGA